MQPFVPIYNIYNRFDITVRLQLATAQWPSATIFMSEDVKEMSNVACLSET
jgi:hypothetical protein